MGELSERLPEGGGAGDRDLGPQEDHQGNPDRLWQSRKKEVKKKVQKTEDASSHYLSCVWTKTTVTGSNTLQQSWRKTIFSGSNLILKNWKQHFFLDFLIQKKI